MKADCSVRFSSSQYTEPHSNSAQGGADERQMGHLENVRGKHPVSVMLFVDS